MAERHFPSQLVGIVYVVLLSYEPYFVVSTYLGTGYYNFAMNRSTIVLYLTDTNCFDFIYLTYILRSVLRLVNTRYLVYLSPLITVW